MANEDSGPWVRQTNTIYTTDEDRWVVSLIVSYSEEDTGTKDPVLGIKRACSAALALTRDEGSDGTQWYVYDRRTGIGRFIDQEDFEGEPIQ